MVPRVLAFLAVFAHAPSAAADDPPREAPPPGAPAWRYSVDVVNRLSLLGYEPVYIVEERAEEPYVAADRRKMRIHVRGRIRAEGEHLRLDIEPYTLVPDDAMRVNAAGVELNALLRVDGFGYVGYYHHSSHNFNFRGFGYGINLNAVVIDARSYRDVAFLGDEGKVMLRLLFHGYPIGLGPAHVLTADANIAPAAAGRTIWRMDGEAVLGHPKVRAEANLSLASGETVPASARLSLAGMWQAGSWLGDFGERLYVGPFFMLGQNFSRTEEFGCTAYSLGLRVDLVLAENAFLR
jgi:hypothetical protein